MEKQGASEQVVMTPFKRAQLHHRRQGDLPNRTDDLAECLDFNRSGDDRILSLTPPDTMETIYKGPMFGIKNVPGFLFAPQALGTDIQRELAYRSVTEYCEAPHRTNIDLCHTESSHASDEFKAMWDLWKEDNRQVDEQNKKKKPKTLQSSLQTRRSFKKLSWATMGYHYDWTARSYDKSLKSDMPSLLSDLSTMFARTSLLLEKRSNPSFKATASIVNFYTTKSLMGGHRDDLELALDKPIVSLSVGLPAIFLLGGKTKEDEPIVPILVRSGDVLCMGGECRLNYHGMARLLPSVVYLPPPDEGLSPSEQDKVHLATFGVSSGSVLSNEDSESLDTFLTDHRLNINVRQVYPDD
jgi:alkylated DNA repair protein alkB homolog 1